MKCFITVIFLSVLFFSGPARGLEQRTKDACYGDYQRHCALNTLPEVKRCFRRKVRRLTSVCLAAIRVDPEFKHRFNTPRTKRRRARR